MHKKSFIINRNTFLHVSTLLGHLQGELFCYRYTKVAFYSWVRMCCWLCTGGRDRREFTPPVHSTQSTAHSHSAITYNLSITVTKSSPWRWPSRVETCGSVLQLTIKLSLCICWWLVFLYSAFCLTVVSWLIDNARNEQYKNGSSFINIFVTAIN
jgi:hypothetical protein